MNFSGIIIGAIAFLTIGIFHPIVIKAEYHFTKRIWPLFLLVGLGFAAASLLVQNIYLSCVFAVIAASCLWSIRELFQQEQRVQKGWFPKKERRSEEPEE